MRDLIRQLRTMSEDWSTLDTEGMLSRRDGVREATTSANVGVYERPFPGMLRRTFPNGRPLRNTVKTLRDLHGFDVGYLDWELGP